MSISPWRSPFPDPANASEDGVVAVGAAPDPALLVEAYTHGIFPWPHRGMPLLWFSPDPRFLLYAHYARVSRSLRKTLRRTTFTVTTDTAFETVIDNCRDIHRPGQGGTWITDELRAGFLELHREGLAHSIETWENDTLVGGFYGLSFGNAFMGESMFAHAPDASKIAFATFVAHAFDKWDFDFVDCQVHTEHTERFGAIHVPRASFLEQLQQSLTVPTRIGPWPEKLDPAEAAAFYGTKSAARADAPASTADAATAATNAPDSPSSDR